MIPKPGPQSMLVSAPTEITTVRHCAALCSLVPCSFDWSNLPNSVVINHHLYMAQEDPHKSSVQ